MKKFKIQCSVSSRCHPCLDVNESLHCEEIMCLVEMKAMNIMNLRLFFRDSKFSFRIS